MSCEPLPSTFAKFVRNLRANEVEDRVDARCVAVGKLSGSVRFTADRDTITKWSAMTIAARRSQFRLSLLTQFGIPLEIFQISRFESGFGRGYESEMLQGAQDALNDRRTKGHSH